MNSGEKQPAHVVHELLVQIGDLVIRGSRDPKKLLRYLQPVIGSPETYADVLNAPPRQAGFMSGFEPELWVPEWERFYREVYGLRTNLMPAFRMPTDQLDHAWPVFCVPEVGLNRTWAECRNLSVSNSFYGDDLEVAVPKHDRTAKDGAYMVRFRARVEADVEFRNLSASKLAARGVKGITLDERLKLEQFIGFMTGGSHLDMVTVTLCAGSRGRGGGRPAVGWGGSRAGVTIHDRCLYGYNICTRSAVL